MSVFGDIFNLSMPICRQSESFVRSLSSFHTYFSLVVNGILTTFVSIFGIVGNCRVIFYLHRSKFGGRLLARSLTCLAIWDIILLVSVMGYYSIQAVMNFFVEGHVPDVCSYMTVLFHPAASAAFMASALMVVAVTLQRYDPNQMALFETLFIFRYFAVNQPLLRRTLSLQWAKIGYHLAPADYITLLTILLKIPTCFELQAATCWIDSETTAIETTPTRFRLSNGYKFGYKLPTSILFSSFGPVFLVSVFTVCIVFSLRHAERRRSTLTESSSTTELSKQQERTSKILILLGLKFLLSHILPAILDLWEAVSLGKYRNVLHVFQYSVDISNFGVVVNSATNFLVYLQTNTTKHKSLLKKVKKMKKKVDMYSFQAFTEREFEILAKTFPELWENDLTHSPTLGQQILLRVIDKKPGLGGFLSLDPESPESWPESPNVIRQGERIASFFHWLIRMNENEDVYCDLYASEREMEVRQKIREIASLHYDLGITFSTEIWKEIKQTILEAVQECTAEADDGETMRAWRKLISFVIGEMKIGFLEETQKECEI